MTLSGIVKYLKARRYSEVKTMAGWIALGEWTPYGQRSHEMIRFVPASDKQHIREVPVNAMMGGLVLGLWEIR